MDEGSAGARRGDPAERTFTYKGHTIKLRDPGENLEAMPALSIDGSDIMVRREETGGVSAPMLNMFATFASLEDLAKSLIDTSPVFLAQGPTGAPNN